MVHALSRTKDRTAHPIYLLASSVVVYDFGAIRWVKPSCAPALPYPALSFPTPQPLPVIDSVCLEILAVCHRITLGLLLLGNLRIWRSAREPSISSHVGDPATCGAYVTN